ncbi:MAG: hypothetical protein V2B18_10045 [Pseudomonadota bacterium]
MTDEKTNDVTSNSTPVVETQTPDGSEPSPPAEETPGNGNHNDLARKSGRFIAAAVVTAVTLCLVAVFVFGVFRMTTQFFRNCPTGLAINDPAPLHWKLIDSPEAVDKPLGVPEKLVPITQLKTGASAGR